MLGNHSMQEEREQLKQQESFITLSSTTDSLFFKSKIDLTEHNKEQEHQEVEVEPRDSFDEDRRMNLKEDFEAEAKLKRLNYLLTQAQTFSKWIASQLEVSQQLKKQNGQARKSRKKETSASSSQNSTVLSRKSDRIKNDSSYGSLTNKPTTAGKKKNSNKKIKLDKNENETEQVDNKVLCGLQNGYHSTQVNEEEISDRQPSLVTGCIMREYQLVGTEWLISMYENGMNGILADEMGLGKTLQTIAFLAHLREHGVWGPILIISPLSTLTNWVNEVHKFTPTIPVLLYHGSPPERAEMRQKHMSKLNSTFPWIVTSYDLCMRDRKYLQKFSWKYIVIDEGHRIKNLNCKLIQELKSYKSFNRLLLTGTPLQNNLSELWSLLNFLMPDIFDTLDNFMDWFNFEQDLADQKASETILNKETKSSIVSNLHLILKPFLLRRVKTEVAQDLPSKKEFVLYCPLMPEQHKLYEGALKGIEALKDVIQNNAVSGSEAVEEHQNPQQGFHKAEYVDKEAIIQSKRRESRTTRAKNYTEVSDDEFFDNLVDEGDAENRSTGKESDDEDFDESPKEKSKSRIVNVNHMKLQNVVMQLRKICNHPYLFEYPEDSDEEILNTSSKKSKKKITKISNFPNIVKISGKMLMLERLLPALFERGHKVLVFSQMTKMLDILCDWAEFVKGWTANRIDGGMNIEERQEQMRSFNHDKSVHLFFLSTRAGGLGLNLTAADTVIIFDSDWNPQMDLQAQDRVHRIGQKKPVIVYRLITQNSVESTILEKANAKRKLEKLVIHKGHFKGSRHYYQSNRLVDVKELASVLAQEDHEHVALQERSQYELITDLTQVLSNEDLDRILDRKISSKSDNDIAQSEQKDDDDTNFEKQSSLKFKEIS